MSEMRIALKSNLFFNDLCIVNCGLTQKPSFQRKNYRFTIFPSIV
jgi:hypothetical protein